MPTNRNNEVSQSFAIGTKIEYMNKLFEVTESNQCCDCSLATICSSSDICANNRNDDILSRDKRINIFGECSSLRRPDSKSVVFVEVPNSTSKDEYYKIIPLWIDNNSTQLRPIKFVLPKDYVIDKEHSDFDKGIITFKRNWLTIEDIYKNLEERNIPIIYINDTKLTSDSKIAAIVILMDIARYFNGNWKYRNRGDNNGYMIAYDKTRTEEDCYQVVCINSDTDMYFGNIMFKNEADAQYVIDNPNFRDILDKIFKI